MRARRGRAVLRTGDAAAVLDELPTGCADVEVTSPPYLGLRTYDAPADGLGGDTVDGYVAALAAILDRLARVLRRRLHGVAGARRPVRQHRLPRSGPVRPPRPRPGAAADRHHRRRPPRLAAACACPGGHRRGGSGWLTRNTITWHKPNAMPHRTRGRLQHQTETVLVLARSLPAVVDLDALPERGDVWGISTVPSPTGHPAAFPPEVARRPILAGSRQGQTVLHPFAGSGTTGVAALERGRRFVGVELSEAYAAAPGAVGEPTVN